MQRIKEESKGFLRTPILFRGTPPYIHHPFYDRDFYEVDGVTLNMRNPEDRRRVEEIYETKIEEAIFPEEIMLMVRKNFRLLWLLLVRSYLPNKDFSKLLGDAWTHSPHPNIDINPEIASEWFKGANKKALMTWREYEEYRKLPSRKRLYRGVANGARWDGLSWTDDLEAAKARGEVLVAYVSRDNIYAIFDRGFSEKEYIARPLRVGRL